MATIEQLQRLRVVLSILLLVNSITMIIMICFMDDYYYWLSINMIVYCVLAIAFYFTVFRLRRKLVQQAVLVGQIVPVTVVRPPPSGPPPPPGFVVAGGNPSQLPPAYSPPLSAAASEPPPPYSQAGPWTTAQSGTGLGQSSAYSQSAFSPPLTAGGQPLAAFNQPGQNAYWNPAAQTR